METAAARHAAFAENFGRILLATTDWDAPTPVKEWTAKDVPAHLLDWLPSILTSLGEDRLPAHADLPLPERFASRSADIQVILEDEQLADQILSGGGPFDGLTVAEMIDRMYTTDVYMHSWDLARSQGIDDGMDRAFAENMLAGMRDFPGMRESGQFGEEQPYDGDDPVEALMAFIGRDPHWTR